MDGEQKFCLVCEKSVAQNPCEHCQSRTFDRDAPEVVELLAELDQSRGEHSFHRALIISAFLFGAPAFLFLFILAGNKHIRAFEMGGYVFMLALAAGFGATYFGAKTWVKQMAKRRERKRRG